MGQHTISTDNMIRFQRTKITINSLYIHGNLLIPQNWTTANRYPKSNLLLIYFSPFQYLYKSDNKQKNGDIIQCKSIKFLAIFLDLHYSCYFP